MDQRTYLITILLFMIVSASGTGIPEMTGGMPHGTAVASTRSLLKKALLQIFNHLTENP
jgi:hypothetical protein